MPSKRNISDKAYTDDQTFDRFVDPALKDEEYFKRLDAIEAAFSHLLKANVVKCKSQFTGALAVMQKTLVPICEAAAICQFTREYWRTLEKRGKITIVRSEGSKKCFIKPSDIQKYLTGKM